LIDNADAIFKSKHNPRNSFSNQGSRQERLRTESQGRQIYSERLNRTEMIKSGGSAFDRTADASPNYEDH
jgi:hypothetical protein